MKPRNRNPDPREAAGTAEAEDMAAEVVAEDMVDVAAAAAMT